MTNESRTFLRRHLPLRTPGDAGFPARSSHLHGRPSGSAAPENAAPKGTVLAPTRRPASRLASQKLGLAVFALSWVLTLGCSGEGDPPAAVAVSDQARPIDGGPCEDGTVTHCSVTLNQESGLLTCYHGKRTCTEGAWSACTDGEETVEVDPSKKEAFLEKHRLAFSSPTECDNNPCDPTCMMYDEDPDDIGLGGSSGSGDDPLDFEGCVHGLCEEGAGLSEECSPCVTSICAVVPGCCSEADPDGWSAECLALVAPVCTGSAPELDLCDFAAFAQTSLSLNSAGTVTGGALGAGSVLGATNATTNVTLSSGGTITLDGGSHLGSVFSAFAVNLINGVTTTSFGVHASVSVSPPSIPTRTLTCLTPSGVTTSLGAGPVAVSPGNAGTFNLDNAAAQLILSGPGDYGIVQFNAGGTLVLSSGGTYRFTSLSLGGAAPTVLVPAGEEVSIETCTHLNLQAGTVREFSRTPNACASAGPWSAAPFWYSTGKQVVHGGNHYTATSGHDPVTSNEPGLGPSWASVWTNNGVCLPYAYSSTVNSAAPLAITWYTNSPTTVALGPSVLDGGALLAPFATADLASGAHTGLVYAETVSTQSGVSLDASGLTGDECESALGVTGAAGTCPVTTAPPLWNEPCTTGRDCQVNHRCEEPQTGPGCGHSKCAPGAALDAGCDECVARICDLDATCCEDRWSGGCVEMVATVCDAVCDDFACLHQPCDVGAPLEPSCDPCIATVCAASGFETCCTENWSFACAVEFRHVCGAPPGVTEPTAGGSLCDYSTFGYHELQTQGATMTGGWVGSPASASQNIANSTVNGHATSSGSLNAFGSVVTGNLLSGSGSIASGTVLGMVLTGTPPTPTLPDKALTGCSSHADPRSGSLAPGTYGDVTVGDGEQLRLSGGTYTFNSLTIGEGGAGATLVLPNDGSIVEINVCGDVEFLLNSSMTGLTQQTAMNVSIYTEGYFAAHGSNTLFGFIISVGTVPFYSGPCWAGDPCDLSLLQPASIYVGPVTTVYGIVAAQRRVDVRGGSVIDSSGLEDMCELLWDPGTTVTWPACPVTLTPDLPTEAATCEPNEAGYVDDTCTGHDLALGVPCDDQVPVCNHGALDFSGVVDIGFWEVSEQQLSTDMPTAPDGVCSGALTISAGSCETLTCSGLPAVSQTLMVDPADTHGECDGRRLDNWSYFDGRACGGALPPRTETQIYEAVCPENSHPRWGLLTWSTETPGSSTITFRATTAASELDLAAAPPPTTLGVAKSTAPDTQNCSRSGPIPECPVDITGVLGLGDYQDPFLQLSIDLVGPESPTLEDFRITYSCVIDQ